MIPTVSLFEYASPGLTSSLWFTVAYVATTYASASCLQSVHSSGTFERNAPCQHPATCEYEQRQPMRGDETSPGGW